jgi:hypothetical protein
MTNQRRQERSQPQANRPFRPVKDTVQAQALGATLLLPPRVDVPGGELAVIADPVGAVVGLMTWDYEETSK